MGHSLSHVNIETVSLIIVHDGMAIQKNKIKIGFSASLTRLISTRVHQNIVK